MNLRIALRTVLLTVACMGPISAETPPPPVDSSQPVELDPLPPLEVESGFVSLFDGETLSGWHCADMSYWSVEDGAITAKSTTEKLATRNHYLVWVGDGKQDNKMGDFELKLRHRILTKTDVNGGFQFRSEMFDGDIPDDCRGYQVDNNTNTTWLARLYDEFGRHTLAWRGEHNTFHPGGEHTIAPIEGHGEPARFRLGEWHEYHLICMGPEITLKINGRVIAKVTDNDPEQHDPTGVLALQLHSGPEMVVQFKDVRVKSLQVVSDAPSSAPCNPNPAAENPKPIPPDSRNSSREKKP